MDDELIELRKAGGNAAKNMVSHMIAMRADSCMIPIEVDGIKYRVTVERKGTEKCNANSEVR